MSSSESRRQEVTEQMRYAAEDCSRSVQRRLVKLGHRRLTVGYTGNRQFIKRSGTQTPSKLRSADFSETWYYDWAYQSEELITFWWPSALGYGFRITFSLPSPLRNGILEDLSAYLIQSPADFHDTRRNDWRRQDNKSTTFWKRFSRYPDPDPNPDYSGTPDSNSDRFWLRLDASAEVCALWGQSSF